MPSLDLAARRLALLTAFAATTAMRHPTQLAAQELQPQPDLPGVYAAGECRAAPFPAQLPALDSVLDSASLATALKATGVDKPLVFGLTLGDLTGAPRVHVLEKKVSDQVASRALQEVDAAIRKALTDREWFLRLRVEVDREPTLRLERSEVCAAVPGPRSLRMQTFAVPAESLAQIRRDASEAARRRRSLQYRVLIDAKGQVGVVELVHSSGDTRTDEVEADALRRRSFTPTKVDGVAVAAWVEVRGDR
jgi:TonB-like protein